MKTPWVTRHLAGIGQFGLLDLLQYVTVCGVLSALSVATGAVSGLLLMLMALALWLRLGPLALASLMAACWAAGASADIADAALPVLRELMVILVAAVVCFWYSRRRCVTERS
jgi:hypothetical protein